MTQKEEVPKKKFFILGIVWGLLMFGFMDVLYPIISDEVLNPQKLLITFPIWMIMGFLFGYTNYVIAKKKNK